MPLRLGKKIAEQANRTGVAERGPAPAVQQSVEGALALIDSYDPLLHDVALSIVHLAQPHDPDPFYRLPSVPGIGKSLSLVLLSAIHDIRRFPRGPRFPRVLPPRQVRAGVCWEAVRHLRREERPRLAHGGLRGSSRTVSAGQPRGPKVPDEPGKPTRPGQSLDPPGPEAGARRVLRVNTAHGVRAAQVSPGVGSGAGAPNASLDGPGVRLERGLGTLGLSASGTAHEHIGHAP
jgi:hypothetical protein